MVSIERKIVELAVKSYGVCSYEELIAGGLTRGTIQHQLRQGFLTRVLKGVYVVAGMQTSETCLYAVLKKLPAAAASRHTAARRHGMSALHEYFSIVNPTSRVFDLDGVHVHRSLHLPESDIQILGGIRVTTPERTLFDLASQLGPRAAYHLLETQFAERHPDSRDFSEWFADHRKRGVRNVSQVALLLDELLDDEPFPQSKLEIVVDERLHEYGVHFMKRQFRPPWYEGRYGITDFGDGIGGSILEADGAGSRKTTAAHENDRQRDLIAAKHGYLTLRAGYRAITLRPHAIFSDIAQILIARHEEGLRLGRRAS